MNVITRFAPSPTGYLHLGGVRTALFNYLFAKHYGGKFVLRIEDTDDKRLVEASLKSIVEGLKWLGIQHDGQIIIQSENIPRHKEIAQQLVSKCAAYNCYCSQEELDGKRAKVGVGYKYDGKCKNRQDIPVGVKPVIRLNSESFEKIEFKDLIVGNMCFERDNLDDFIILRSDGMPTYMFAVVVDDHDAEITHVIRGNDHLVNTAKQLMIYKLMEWKEPEYAHLPLINSEDGTKMSKRKHAVDLLNYKNDGFLPEGLVNYLMTLGWTSTKDILSLQEAIQEFGIGKLHHSAACFNMTRLRHINNHYLKEMANHDPKRLMGLINENYVNKYKKAIPNFAFNAIEQSLTEITKRADTLKEIIKQSFFYFGDWKNYKEEKMAIKKLNDSIFSRTDKAQFLKTIYEEFEKLTDWNQINLEGVISNLCIKFSQLKKAEIMKFLRGVVTGTLNSFSIVMILEVLGRERVLTRLKN